MEGFLFFCFFSPKQIVISSPDTLYIVYLVRPRHLRILQWHHMRVMAPQITGNTIVCSKACPAWHQRKYQNSTLLAFWKENPPAVPSHSATNAEDVSISWNHREKIYNHYNDVIMGTMTSQITSLTIVYSAVCSGANQRKYQISSLLGTGEFPAQKASNAENVSIWRRHHVTFKWIRHF